MRVECNPIAAPGAKQQAKWEHAGIKGLEQRVGGGRMPQHDAGIPEQPLTVAHTLHCLRQKRIELV